jgi:hypothetical protein
MPVQRKARITTHLLPRHSLPGFGQNGLLCGWQAMKIPGGETMKVKIVVIVDDAWSDYNVLRFVKIDDLPKVAGMLATITASKISGKISRAREASKKR